MITNLKNILLLLKKLHKKNNMNILTLEEFENLYDNIETYDFTVKEIENTNYNINTSNIGLIGKNLFLILADIEDIELIIQEFIEALEKAIMTIEKINILKNNNVTIDFTQPIKNEHLDFIKKLYDILSLIEKICLHHKTIRTPKKLIALQHRYLDNFEQATSELNSHIQSMNLYNKKELEQIKTMLQKINMTFSTLATIIRKVAFQFNYDHCD